jgi:uncharacterized membrane protein YfcA
MSFDVQSLGMGLSAGLYAFVGHGGGSAYLALGAVKSQALLLNLVVAALSGGAFALGGHLRWRLLLPLLAGSVPAVLLATRMDLGIGRYLLALALLCAGFRLMAKTEDRSTKALPAGWVLVAVGMGLGVMAGLTGIGGGVYLSPVLLLLGWAGNKETAATSALFIWVNSLAGLCAMASIQAPPAAWAWMAFTGGILGAVLGARLAPARLFRPALGLVLMAAALGSL